MARDIDLYRPICRHIVTPVWAGLEGSPYLKYLKYLEASQYFSEEEVREIQFRMLRELIVHAYEKTEHYKSKFDEAGIRPDDIRSFEDYASVPILEKDEVRDFGGQMIAPDEEKYVQMLTSGSTGKPLRAWRDRESQAWKRASNARSNRWTGYELGERIYQLYGDPEKEMRGMRKFRSIFRRKVLRRVEILDLLLLSEESMRAFAEKMRRKPPSIIWGHAHALYSFAKFLEKSGIDDIRPKGIYSAGMVLHEREREQVEKVFGMKMQDRYGCEELGMLACECKEHMGLHINSDVHYVEVLRKDGSHVAPGESGQIIVTDLRNKVMPFLRYRLEDVVVLSDKRCSCGRTQPLIQHIEGRVADFLLRPDGKLVSGISLSDHFAGHIPGVAQMQMVQEELDLLTLRIVRVDGFNEGSISRISELVEEFFGKEMRYECDYVEDIPKTRSGKFRFAVCKVEHGLI